MQGVHVGMVLPEETLKAVDNFAKRQSEITGLRVTRSDALRFLLKRSLEELKFLKEKSSSRRRGP